MYTSCFLRCRMHSAPYASHHLIYVLSRFAQTPRRLRRVRCTVHFAGSVLTDIQIFRWPSNTVRHAFCWKTPTPCRCRARFPFFCAKMYAHVYLHCILAPMHCNSSAAMGFHFMREFSQGFLRNIWIIIQTWSIILLPSDSCCCKAAFVYVMQAAPTQRD